MKSRFFDCLFIEKTLKTAKGVYQFVPIKIFLSHGQMKNSIKNMA